MKIAVIGANGQLGSDVVRAFENNGDDVYAMTHSDIEVDYIDSVFDGLRNLQPEIVVNTAAMHHVEKCEMEPEEAYAVNAVGPKNLAAVGNDLGFVLVHISTDYVFDGTKGTPYDEDDIARPLNVYGETKLQGEQFVRSEMDKYFILRTSALYGTSPCRGKSARNFIQLMLKLAKERGEVRVVDSEVVTPTSTAELAEQILVLSRADRYGLYHATPEGSCSWFEFARTIFSLTNTQASLRVASPGEFPAKTPRPKYSVLENRALKIQGLNRFGTWQTGLETYVEQLMAASV
jgi:dTDP-4-dehydrorhamnose reductase